MSKPILKNIPEMIETERLILRVPRFGDGKQLNEAILESIQQLHPWMIFAQHEQSVDETEEYCRRSYVGFMERSNLPFLIVHKESNQMIGSTGLHRIKWEIPRMEIGYWLRTSMQGNGYVTETVRALVQFAFTALGAKRLEIRCDALNERSSKVAERAGFRFEACLQQYTRNVHGELADELVYVMLEKDWLEKNKCNTMID